MNYIQLQLSSLNTNNLSNTRNLQAVQNACLGVIQPNLLFPTYPKVDILVPYLRLQAAISYQYPIAVAY